MVVSLTCWDLLTTSKQGVLTFEDKRSSPFSLKQRDYSFTQRQNTVLFPFLMKNRDVDDPKLYVEQVRSFTPQADTMLQIPHAF
jgi:hypothetical protein